MWLNICTLVDIERMPVTFILLTAAATKFSLFRTWQLLTRGVMGYCACLWPPDSWQGPFPILDGLSPRPQTQSDLSQPKPNTNRSEGLPERGSDTDGGKWRDSEDEQTVWGKKIKYDRKWARKRLQISVHVSFYQYEARQEVSRQAESRVGCRLSLTG